MDGHFRVLLALSHSLSRALPLPPKHQTGSTGRALHDLSDTELRNLQTWAQMLNTPAWLCFVSAGSMWAGGIALIVGFLTPLASFAILVSMAYAMVLEIKGGFPFIAADPYLIPEGDYAGPMGVGEPPSWEKAAMYVVMCLVLIFCGGGMLSLDTLLIDDLLRVWLGI